MSGRFRTNTIANALILSVNGTFKVVYYLKLSLLGCQSGPMRISSFLARANEGLILLVLLQALLDRGVDGLDRLDARVLLVIGFDDVPGGEVR